MNEQDVMRRYKRRSRIIIAIALIAVLAVLFSSLSIAVKLLLVGLLLILEIVALAVLMSRTTNALLTEHLDPQLYYTVCTMLRMVPANGLSDILTAYYLYDYHAAYNLCVEKLAPEQYKKYEFDYKLYLARMFFDGGETDKLRNICEEFETAFETNKGLRLVCGDLIRFYRLFCEGDYAACSGLYKQRMSEKTYSTNRLFKIQVDYGYAVSCYKNGDIEEATAVFTDITKEAPNLNFAYIAREYLEKIACGEERGECISYKYDKEYRAPAVTNPKPPFFKTRLCVFVLAALVVVTLLIRQDLPRSPLDAVRAYDESVSAILCSLPVGDTKDLLCLCSDEYENYTVAYLHAKGNERYQCKIACEGLCASSCYAVQSPDSDLVLYCTVYDNIADIPSNAVAYAPFAENGIARYFVIISLEEKESLIYNGEWIG